MDIVPEKYVISAGKVSWQRYNFIFQGLVFIFQGLVYIFQALIYKNQALVYINQALKYTFVVGRMIFYSGVRKLL